MSTHLRSALAQVLALALALCACDAGDPAAGNLGTQGASCVRSPDCAPPLQCLYGVCQTVVPGPDASEEPSTPLESDAGSAETAGPEAVEEAAAAEAGAADASPEVAAPPEVASPQDVPPKPQPDATVFSDCEGLGIGPKWSGSFVGIVSYDLSGGSIPGLGSATGSLLVSGSLGFEITCLEGKLIVDGEMSGVATAEGTVGSYPYTSKLKGYYTPSTGHLKTTMVDGMVVIYDFVEVYFDGVLEGDLQTNGTFEGTWSGSHAGNNLNLQGTAAGNGTWKASESP